MYFIGIVKILVYLDGTLKYTVDSTLTGETYGQNPTSHKQFYTYKNDGSGKPLTTVGAARFFTSTGKNTAFYIENLSLRLTVDAPEAPEIFTRLANEKSFPIVQFDWTL